MNPFYIELLLYRALEKISHASHTVLCFHYQTKVSRSQEVCFLMKTCHKSCIFSIHCVCPTNRCFTATFIAKPPSLFTFFTFLWDCIHLCFPVHDTTTNIIYIKTDHRYVVSCKKSVTLNRIIFSSARYRMYLSCKSIDNDTRHV
jgi:hypothetical protein